VLDLTRGTPEEDDAWAAQHDEHLRKVDEVEACEQLDRLREEQMFRDRIDPPKLSREPVRRDPCEGFLNHKTLDSRS